jgi:hypothetical protein
MSEPYVTHKNIAEFANTSVNLKQEDVEDYRAQVNRLREKLDKYIADHPDYALVKMLHSGSVRKGTALKTINDMDVAVYVKADKAPSNSNDLVNWLVARLREAYSNLNYDQFTTQTHCVTVSFRGSGLDVDVVPVLYEGDSNDCGYLITKDIGDRVLTSIPLHLQFIRNRKTNNPKHFAQVIRLIKWWSRIQKRNNESFRFKSFMAELICAYLADKGLNMSNYPVALESFFAYIVSTGLKNRIYFTDYYNASKLPSTNGAVIEIFDPVNPDNNVALRYTDEQRELIVEAAYDALDALTEAHHATTQGRAIDLWKIVLGPSFKI